MEAGKRKISEIFAIDKTLEIPFFQRSYVWDKENWDRFLEDMVAVSIEKKPYFMGALMLKQTMTPINAGDVRLVIDGQQRLTTIVLLFKELNSFKKLDSGLFNFFNMHKKIILQHNHTDVDVFESIVKGDLAQSKDKKYSNNQVWKCYEFFRQNKEKISQIDPLAIVGNLYFVGIDLKDDEDEQQIFDTINSLGVRLTTGELLKNELFRREDKAFFDKTWKAKFESNDKEFWDDSVTSSRLTRPNIDMLLQSYLLICNGGHEYVSLDQMYKQYKKLIKEKSIERGNSAYKDFVNKLMEYADTYFQNINHRQSEEDIRGDDPMERMNIVLFGLNQTMVIPYILYVLKEADTGDRNNIFALLESYIARRVICKWSSKNYNKFFAALIRNGVNDYDSFRTEIYKEGRGETGAFPDDESLRNGFLNSNLVNQLAKTVLYLIEKSLHDKKQSLTLFGLNKYELEHIMPKKWRNHWPGDLDEQKSRERDQVLQKLGNLTIITSVLNKSIRDSAWEIKKNGKGKNKNKGLLAYSKGMQIFDRDEYLHSDHWDEEKIEERGKFLFDQARKIWPKK